LYLLSNNISSTNHTDILKDFNGSAALLFTVLLICGGVGVLILLILRNIYPQDDVAINDPVVQEPTPIPELLKQSLMMMKHKEMLLLLVIMFYSGFELSFYSGEFPLIMDDSKLIGAVMSCLGAAEVLGKLL
jgi:hypothetical protein